MSGNTTQEIQAFVFDLDGVITDTARYHYLAWKQLADAEGVRFDQEFNEQLKGVDRMASLDLILSRSSRTYSSEQRQALAESKNENYRQLIATMTTADLLPGALEALKAVRAAGLKIGLASVSKNAPMVLDRLGIAKMFDFIADAAQVRRGKPDPEIFLPAARGLGAQAGACIGVEDAVAGVQAIKAAGMYAIGVGDQQTLHGADRVLPGLQDFRLAEYLPRPSC